MNKIQEEKKRLRNLIREQKKEIDPERIRIASENLFLRFEKTSIFQEAKCLLFYHALPDEVQTNDPLKRWYKEKEIILPVVNGDDLILRYYHPDRIRKGAYGISEPTGDIFTDFDKIDLALIPGIGFDKTGNRLGRGKGFYDRLLPRIKAPKIGIAFSWQLFDLIPTEPLDHSLDGIITEKEFFLNI